MSRYSIRIIISHVMLNGSELVKRHENKIAQSHGSEVIHEIRDRFSRHSFILILYAIYNLSDFVRPLTFNPCGVNDNQFPCEKNSDNHPGNSLAPVPFDRKFLVTEIGLLICIAPGYVAMFVKSITAMHINN